MTIFKEVKIGFNNLIRRINWRKNWMPDIDYKKGDVVNYFGIELLCIKDHHSSPKYEEDEDCWQRNKKMRVIQ